MVAGNATPWIAAAVGILALWLRLRALAAADPAAFFTPDSPGYEQLALSLLRYGSYTYRPDLATAMDLIRTPGYPVFLAGIYAVFGYGVMPVVLAQAVLGACVAAITVAIAARLGIGPWARAVAGIVVAIDPVSIFEGTTVMTETVFTLLLGLGVLALLHHRAQPRALWPALAGAMLGAATLTRPIALLLPLALAPCLLFGAPRAHRRAALIAAVSFLVVGMAIPAAWATRNYREAGVPTVSTITGENLLYWRAGMVVALSEGRSFEHIKAQYYEATAHMIIERGLSPREADAYKQREAVAILRAHPGLTALMMLYSLRQLVGDPGAQPAWWLWTVYGLAVAGVLALRRRRDWPTLFLVAAIIAYSVALSLGPEAYSRFRVPLMPYLGMLAGAGVAALLAPILRWRAPDYGAIRSATAATTGAPTVRTKP